VEHNSKIWISEPHREEEVMKINELTRFLAVPAIAAAALAAAIAWSGPVQAQKWPERSVRVIVPFGAGGGTDIMARMLGDTLQNYTGQRFVVDNRAGAGGLIGAELVVNSPPDGHTLLFTTATIAINTTLFSKTLKFNTRTELVPSTLVADAPNVLCVHPSVPAKTVPQLIALAKRMPGGLNNGVNTPGSTSHLAGELLMQLAKVKTTIVPFTGGGPAVLALMTGDVDMLFATGPVAQANLRTGRIRCLAVTTAEKNPAFPDLPTMGEFVPGFEIGNWYAMFFPKGTSAQAVNGMSALIRKALSEPKMKSLFEREGIVPVGSTPEELRKTFEADIVKYEKVIRAGNIPLR
jgi:tripartite-type tricarboxylate transporter receptor subunit TctC